MDAFLGMARENQRAGGRLRGSKGRSPHPLDLTFKPQATSCAHDYDASQTTMAIFQRSKGKQAKGQLNDGNRSDAGSSAGAEKKPFTQRKPASECAQQGIANEVLTSPTQTRHSSSRGSRRGSQF